MLKTNIQSNIEVIDLVAKAFTQYLEATNREYKIAIKPLQSEKNLISQNENVLLIYKLYKKQQGSAKKPFEERTFLRPYFVNSNIGVGGITQYENFEFFFDNMFEFQFYSQDYFILTRQAEDFIAYMGMLSTTKNVFSENGIKLPIFWEQTQDEIVEVGNTFLYKSSLFYQFQTKQTISKQLDVIRKINTYVELSQ